jgi:hypothetical protein
LIPFVHLPTTLSFFHKQSTNLTVLDQNKKVADYNSGLIGPIVVTKKGSFDADTHRPTDVGTEFFILPTIFDENKSHYLELNTLRIPGSENLDVRRERKKKKKKSLLTNKTMTMVLVVLSFI